MPHPFPDSRPRAHYTDPHRPPSHLRPGILRSTKTKWRQIFPLPYGGTFVLEWSPKPSAGVMRQSASLGENNICKGIITLGFASPTSTPSNRWHFTECSFNNLALSQEKQQEAPPSGTPDPKLTSISMLLFFITPEKGIKGCTCSTR